MSNKETIMKKIKEENERRMIAESLNPQEFPKTIQLDITKKMIRRG